MNDEQHTRGANPVWPALVYAALLAIGIPWYWPRDGYALMFGMPAWVVIAIVVSLIASLFTAWLLRRPWPGEQDTEQH